MELELVEEWVYDDDGTEVLQVAGWKDFAPIDSTSAERKRRFRRRLYGDAAYYGTEGDVMEVLIPSADEAAESDSAGRALFADLDRIRELEELGRAVIDELDCKHDSGGGSRARVSPVSSRAAVCEYDDIAGLDVRCGVFE